MKCEYCRIDLGENPLSHKCNATGAEYVLCDKHYKEHVDDYHGGITQPRRKPYFTKEQLARRLARKQNKVKNYANL